MFLLQFTQNCRKNAVVVTKLMLNHIKSNACVLTWQQISGDFAAILRKIFKTVICQKLEEYEGSILVNISKIGKSRDIVTFPNLCREGPMALTYVIRAEVYLRLWCYCPCLLAF